MTQPPPARYRTTNLSSYNSALKKRGSLLICLDKEMTWLAPHDGSPGRPAVFSDAAIQFCLTIKVLFKLPLRQTTGMVAILDGAGWHGAAALVIPDNLSLLTLPPYSPELKKVENVWQYLRANWLAISVFDTYEVIVEACCKAWNRFADQPAIVTSIASRCWATVT